MGEPVMELGEAELVRIGDYVKGNLKSWLGELAPALFAPDAVTNTQLLERIIRLEERFERVDSRFEDLVHAMDRGFDLLGKRIGTIQWLVIALFTVATVGAALLRLLAF